MAAATASGRSATRGKGRSSAPAARTWAHSEWMLASRIWPGPGSAPASTSSLPVVMTATTAWGCTGTWAQPMAASTPISAGRRMRPRATTSPPAGMSSPARRMCAPRRAGADSATQPSPAWASSTGTMASAPGGRTAPVMIR